MCVFTHLGFSIERPLFARLAGGVYVHFLSQKRSDHFIDIRRSCDRRAERTSLERRIGANAWMVTWQIFGLAVRLRSYEMLGHCLIAAPYLP